MRTDIKTINDTARRSIAARSDRAVFERHVREAQQALHVHLQIELRDLTAGDER